MSGYRLVSGFETLEAVGAAHTWVANVRKATQRPAEQAEPDHAAEIARLKAVIDQLERREILAVAQQATPEPVGGHDMAVMLERGAKAWAGVDPQDLRAGPTPEPLTRFCPGCGSVGDVPDSYRDCCPDGAKARMIPASLAHSCHDLFKLAIGAAQQSATPEPVGEPVARVELMQTGGNAGLATRIVEIDDPLRERLRPGDLLFARPAPGVPDGWTEADADAARLAMELECLLLDTKDTAAVSRWWKSANEALDLHRARLAAAQAKGGEQ